jgi:hypothetical protein
MFVTGTSPGSAGRNSLLGSTAAGGGGGRSQIGAK